MKINSNIYRRPDGIVEIDILFPFPLCITQFRDIEETRRFFEVRAGFIPGHPDLYEAYYSAYRVLAEAEFYSAELKYICQINERLILQFDFPNYSTAEHFFENVQKL